jgi:hypothetical protein
MRHLRTGAFLAVVLCLFWFAQTVHAQQSAAEKLKSKITELQRDTEIRMKSKAALSSAADKDAIARFEKRIAENEKAIKELGEIAGKVAALELEAADFELAHTRTHDTALKKELAAKIRSLKGELEQLVAGVSGGAGGSAAPAEPPKAPTVNRNISDGDREITGKAVPGATVEMEITRSEGGKQTESTVANTDGSYSVPLASGEEVSGGDAIRARQTDAASRLQSLYSKPVKIPPGGGLMGLLVGGSVFSQQQTEFSQADPFFGFITGYTTKRRFHGNFNLRFQGIFTAAPRAAEAPETTTPTNIRAFLASRKSFDFDMHGWHEFTANAVGVGPYFAIGGSTVLTKNELNGEAVKVNNEALDTTNVKTDNDIKRFHEAGLMLNLYHGQATERRLVVQSMLAYGYYESLKGLVPGHRTQNRFVGRLRIFPTGLRLAFGKQVDLAPMFGIDLNAGRGPDQIKFFTGVAVKLKSIREADELLSNGSQTEKDKEKTP